MGGGGWYVKVSADSTIIGMPEYSVEDRVFCNVILSLIWMPLILVS